MHKPRDYDADLKALEDKARKLKARWVQQLGELVIATGADALAPEQLAGARIVPAETTDPGKREALARRGAAMFRQRSRRGASSEAAKEAALQRNRAARKRHQAARARHDRRDWEMDRRMRTRQLIELGGLVA